MISKVTFTDVPVGSVIKFFESVKTPDWLKTGPRTARNMEDGCIVDESMGETNWWRWSVIIISPPKSVACDLPRSINTLAKPIKPSYA